MSTETAERRNPVRLVGDLVGGLLDLVRSSARLFVYEAKQTSASVARRILFLIPALAFLVAGIILLVGAAAILVGDWMGSRWQGFAAVGGGSVVLGTAAVLFTVWRLRQIDFGFPATLSELEKDVEWLKGRTDG